MNPSKYHDLDDTENHPFMETLVLHMINNDWKVMDADDFWEKEVKN